MAKKEKTVDLDSIERAFDAADDAAGADRAAITKAAQLDAAEAVAMTGIAMESDAEAAEAARLAIISERAGNREAAKKASAKAREARKAAKKNHKAATKSARAAYNAVRFSDPNSLGFLRVITIVLAFNILATVFTLTTYIKGSYTIELDQGLNLFLVVLQGVTIWLVWKRKKFARMWTIVTSAVSIVIGIVATVASAAPSWTLILTVGFDVFLLLYFLLSKRAKATLVEPFNTRTLNDDLDEDESYWRPQTWEFWRNLIVYFVIFSIVGHWMEAGVCLLIKYGIVPGTYDPTSQIWSDWLYPFPVYGIGFCACALLLYPLKNILQRKFKRTIPSLIVSFVANALVCSLIEFVMGLAVNADLQLWDYSDMFGNIMGQVCLQNALFFGLVATIMTWVVYPLLERGLRRLPNEYATGIFIVAVVACALLYALYYINLPMPDLAAAAQFAGPVGPAGLA